MKPILNPNPTLEVGLYWSKGEKIVQLNFVSKTLIRELQKAMKDQDGEFTMSIKVRNGEIASISQPGHYDWESGAVQKICIKAWKCLKKSIDTANDWFQKEVSDEIFELFETREMRYAKKISFKISHDGENDNEHHFAPDKEIIDFSLTKGQICIIKPGNFVHQHFMNYLVREIEKDGLDAILDEIGQIAQFMIEIYSSTKSMKWIYINGVKRPSYTQKVCEMMQNLCTLLSQQAPELLKKINFELLDNLEVEKEPHFN